MADDIKRVTYDVPAAPVKNTRRQSRRSRQEPPTKPKPVPTPTIPVAQAAGAALVKPPVAAAKPQVSAAKPQVAGSPVPLPMMATTHAVGGKPKKPSLKVALPYNNSHVAAVATPTKEQMPRPAIKIVQRETRRAAAPLPPVSKVLINPEKRKNVTLKRRFAEKRITVRIENPSKVRKTRDAIRRKVANMPLADVTKKLHERGMGKPNSKLAEDLQRKMLVDLMMFPVPV